MRGPWRIGRIMGIDISVDPSWFVILFLMVYGLGFLEFPRALHVRAFYAHADWISVSLGIAASLLLFGSVLAHELSHSWMAIERGIPVMNITLFIFGGVARISDEPDAPASEFLIAIMGPLMSVALAAVFGAAWIWLRLVQNVLPSGWSVLPMILLTGILAQANGALALFNLAPGFPLDGGRVLRAILWGLLHDVRRATRIATWLGQFIAVALIGWGAWLFATDFDLNGIWYVFIGVFLWNAAREGYRQTVVRETLRGVHVDQLMTRNVEFVSPDISIAAFVTQYLIPRREQTFAVSDGERLLGTVGATQIRRVPRDQWPLRCIRDVMTPRAGLIALDGKQSAATALRELAQHGAEELPVIENERVVGFLGREALARFLSLHVEMSAK